MAKKYATKEEEILDRTRRIETRITTLAIGLGVEMNTQKPLFACDEGPAMLTLPSLNCSLKEMRAAVPAGWTGKVDLVIGVETIGQIVLMDRS